MFAILATDNQLSIGQQGSHRLPWKCPFDLRFYKAMTTGLVNWVTLSTWKGLPRKVANDPLRAYQILSSQTHTFNDLINIVNQLDNNHVLIGGYQAYLALLNHMPVILHGQVKTDTFTDLIIPSDLLSRDINLTCYDSPTYKLTIKTNDLSQLAAIKTQVTRAIAKANLPITMDTKAN